MKRHVIALCAALFPLLALSSVAAACGTDAPGDPPCVTRVERGWTFDSELHQDQARVQVTTWRWVWDEDAGAWVQQAVVEDRATSNRDEHDDFSQWQSSFTGAAWDWSWDE